MRKLLAALGLSVILLAVTPVLEAQGKNKKEDSTLRSVQGQVTDDAGTPVAGAAVHLKNMKTLQVRSFITLEDGSYAFHGLSTNVDYELKAENHGISSDTRTLSVFDSRKKAVMNLKLNKKG